MILEISIEGAVPEVDLEVVAAEILLDLSSTKVLKEHVEAKKLGEVMVGENQGRPRPQARQLVPLGGLGTLQFDIY